MGDTTTTTAVTYGSGVTGAGTQLLLTEQTNWGDFYITLSGNADFDEYVFEQLRTDYLTPTQASYLWEYTDGYKMTIESTIRTANVLSAHCIKKTKSAITGGSYDTGSLCFETTWGGLQNVGFYAGIGADTVAVNQADSKWSTQFPTTLFGDNNWYGSTNTSYKGFLDFFPTTYKTNLYDGTNASPWSDLSNKGLQSYWSIYQPKWQADDFYKNNFRVNPGDSITMYYKDGITGFTQNSNADPSQNYAIQDQTTAFTSTGEKLIEGGAQALTFAASIAFAAAALTF